jgi:hypothetical protein
VIVNGLALIVVLRTGSAAASGKCLGRLLGLESAEEALFALGAGRISQTAAA